VLSHDESPSPGETPCLITSTRPALSVTVRPPQRSRHPMPHLAEVCPSALRERAGGALRYAPGVMPKDRPNPAVEVTSIAEGGLGALPEMVLSTISSVRAAWGSPTAGRSVWPRANMPGPISTARNDHLPRPKGVI
jgi:hypothetical protein